ncbi:transcriptional protein SWT1 [Brachionichthys hirsutus]|uniref:transcriptional protein SWT1 n=1 Tax=Brachionichthys hirsutus TaxID=412623 RepID=UPI003604AE98
MSKKSKKKRHKKLSSEEDEKESKEQDAAKKHKRAKTEQDVKSRERWTSSTFHPIEDAFQSIRPIKKPVYRLAEARATEQKPFSKEKECTKTKSVSVSFLLGTSSSKVKDYTQWKSNIESWSKKVERPSSKSLNTSDAAAAPQRRETSKGCLDEKSHQRNPSKLKKQLLSSSQGSAEQKDQAQDELTRKRRAVDPPRSRKVSSTIKTQKLSKTSEDLLRRKEGEPYKESCRRHREVYKRKLCKETKATSASTTKLYFTSAKSTPSASSSEAVKNVPSVPGNASGVTHSGDNSTSAQQKPASAVSPLPITFKIPKMVQSRPVGDDGIVSESRNLNHGTKHSNSVASTSNFKQAHSHVDTTKRFSSGGRDKLSSLQGQLPPVFDPVSEPWCGEMQVVEELHLARSEKRLGVNVVQSYGELTCMDTDLPEEGAVHTHCKPPPQQDLILVLDTNILLSHLDYVKKIRSHGLGATGFPVVLIPWVVLQEMDSLKKGQGLSYSVARLATPAISYIYNSLKSREPHLWGQSMQQAAESSDGLKAENNDDRVLQCCLQYQRLYPECALTLCTNDKNLCSKAILSGVKALSKNDLEADFRTSSPGLRQLQNAKASALSPIGSRVSPATLSENYTSPRQHRHEQASLSVGLAVKDNKQPSSREDEKKICTCVSEFEDCLRDALSDVLEVEMKAVYDDLWLEIVYLKPPWTLQDVLKCFKKHWIAVFGDVVPRWNLQTVLNLLIFFNSGKPVDCSSTSSALQEAKKLVKAFEKRSSRVAGALSMLNDIYNKLQPQDESSAGDVIMNDDCNEDTQPVSNRARHQEVWTLFENIWNNAFQKSMEVFKALGFDPRTMQSSRPMGSLAPHQDALACLHELSSTVSQLLLAFSSFLSSTPGSEEVQSLLSVIYGQLEFQNTESRLTTKDFIDCFSQPDYREKLRVGGSQLMELKGALDQCVRTTGQHVAFTT